MTCHFVANVSVGPHWISVQLTFYPLPCEKSKFRKFQKLLMADIAEKKTPSNPPSPDMIDSATVTHSNVFNQMPSQSVRHFDDAENRILKFVALHDSFDLVRNFSFLQHASYGRQADNVLASFYDFEQFCVGACASERSHFKQSMAGELNANFIAHKRTHN